MLNGIFYKEWVLTLDDENSQEKKKGGIASWQSLVNNPFWTYFKIL